MKQDENWPAYLLFTLFIAVMVLLVVFVVLAFEDRSATSSDSEGQSSPHSLATYWKVHQDPHGSPAHVTRSQPRLIPPLVIVKPRPKPTVSQSPSSSPGPVDWDAVAKCESGGNWQDNTGNGYFGGLQMNMQFWRSYHGDRYAARPDLASKAQQIAVAEHAYRVRGLSPWPTCGRFG